ncbi:hypothetical protein CY652_02830 [Burkholderia sp. WAC0059]|uniref:hypothetical protein n=1 Tax=Burkholderia sp. WAC0059 TaxID=2066022 RepID=UPI000C7F41F4|nr:hypothetical protein [Burkholderia sp. WAC0059]PLZ03926.1 hypothetical protein CY652_02830 [Burkholderia sp. WAC0059]
MQAAAPRPEDAAHHRALAQEARERGDELAALAHLIAAKALDEYAAGAAAEAARQVCTVATGYFMKGDHERAQYWYGLTLALDERQALAWLNLGAIHTQAGRSAEARQCQDRAYGLQRVYVEEAGQPVRRVLLLCAGRAAGNVPFDELVPTPRNARIKYAIDCAAEDEDESLPAVDLAVNAIGEPDVAGPLHARLERFARRFGRPLLNLPARVAQTRRDRLPALLAGLDGVETACCMRVEAASDGERVGETAGNAPGDGASETAGETAQRLAEAGLVLPLLVRPATSHGGQGLVRCESGSEFDAALRAQSGACYVSAYRDCRSPDGHFRKYRVVFVDREPLPYHLAISPHWMVHYYTAGMEGERWKLEEEASFLADPAAALGARAWAAVAAVGRRLDLDYAGVDFTLLPGAGVFVFEANATMLVHRERPGGVLAHKNAAVARIAGAFERLLDARGRATAA